MIIMNAKLNHVYGFDDFQISFTYKRRLKDKPSVYLVGS